MLNGVYIVGNDPNGPKGFDVVVGGCALLPSVGMHPYNSHTLRGCPRKGVTSKGETMKLRKNKTTPKSCQITIGDDIIGIKPEKGQRNAKGAGWDEGDELVARVVEGKHGKYIELRRLTDIMSFMTGN